MPLSLPVLPDARSVTESIKGWSRTDARYAELTGSGLSAPQALSRWSVELLQANRLVDALAVLRAALALSPHDSKLWTNYGAALNQNDSPAEAANCLERALSLERSQPDTWLLLGLVRKKLGELAAAEAAYKTAIEQDPDSTVAWQFLGLLKQEQRDFTTAIVCLQKCVEGGSADAALLANLGKLCYQLCRFPEACNAYERASALDPDNLHFRRMARKSLFLLAVLEGKSIDDAIIAFQKSFSTGEVYAEKDLVDLFRSTFSLLSGFGHLEAAARVGRKQLELWPANASMAYLLKAVTGDAALDRSTPEYVVEYFDSFAEGFDAQLVEALGYDIPEKICAAVRRAAKPDQLYDTLDAGCGTGLCGPLLRPMSRRLTGVDLSPKMLELAQRRSVYNEVICDDLTSFLGNSTGQFDLMVAADVLIYFGDLTPVFTGAGRALRAGGLLAISTESWAGLGYRVQPSGRFSHAAEYVRSRAAAEFEEIAFVETTIRLDATGRLPGNIFVFRRR